MNIPFPIKGIHKGRGTSQQPRVTSPDMNNIRLFDVLDHRARGGQRPGLDKLYSQQIGGIASPIVAVCSVTTVN